MPRYGDTSIDMPYVQQQVIRGTVQLTLPTAGIILVRPASTGPMEPMLACRLDSVGGLVGATAYQTILPGQQVFIHRYVDDYHCSLVSVTDNGDQLIGVRSASLLYNYPWTVPVGKSQLDKKIKAQIDTLMYGRNSGFVPVMDVRLIFMQGIMLLVIRMGVTFLQGELRCFLKEAIWLISSQMQLIIK